jgi:hypothetical protein
MQKGKWHKQTPCSEEELQALVGRATVQLPPEYVAYLRESNGGGGDIGVEPGWIEFWRAKEVPENNRGYEVQLAVPGFYAFGSDGDGEMFAFDTRAGKPWPIVMIPFIPMTADEAIKIAPDFATFRSYFQVRLDAPPRYNLID